MKSLKVMKTQAKYMNSIWFYACEEGGRIRFVGAKKRLVNGKEVIMLVALAASKAMKMNKNPKGKATDESDTENDAEHFKIESNGMTQPKRSSMN